MVGECRFYIADGAWPSVAFDGANYLVVYADYTHDFYGDMYGIRVTTSGAVLDRKGFIISSSADSEYAPRLIFNGNTYFTIWRKQDLNTIRIFGTRIMQDGAVLDPQGIDIFPFIGNIGGNHDVASDGTNFFAVTGYTVIVARQVYGLIYGTRINADGIILDPSGILISTSGVNGETSVASDGVNYFVVWTDRRNTTELEEKWDTYGTRITPEGNILDPWEIVISTIPGYKYHPSVMFGQGIYLVVWSYTDGQYGLNESDIYGTRVTSFGYVIDPSGIPVSTALGLQDEPDIAFDGSNFLVVWYDYRNGPNWNPNVNVDVYGARVSIDGSVLDP